MELSAIAIKALISFSLGIAANTNQTTITGDSITSKKTITTVNIKKSKKDKPQELKSSNYIKKTNQEELNSCNKCGKG